MIDPKVLCEVALAAQQARHSARAELNEQGVRLEARTPPNLSISDRHYFQLSWRDLTELHPKGVAHVIEGWLRQVDRKLAGHREEA